MITLSNVECGRISNISLDIYIQIYGYEYIHTDTFIRMYMYAYMYIYTYIYIHIYMYINTLSNVECGCISNISLDSLLFIS
jgi:hypothetical protein